MTNSPPGWNARYRQQDTPWDSRLVSKELKRVLEEQHIAPCRVLEPGCGTGTNAIYLAQQGFEVTAVDVSERALETAALKAQTAGVEINFVLHDINGLKLACEPFDFIFDRGCFHCARKIDTGSYLQTLARYSRPGTRWLTLCGNANSSAKEDEGPPRLTEAEIRNDLSDLFEIIQIREFHFEDEGEVQGPLGWSVLSKRKPLSD